MKALKERVEKVSSAIHGWGLFCGLSPRSRWWRFLFGFSSIQVLAILPRLYTSTSNGATLQAVAWLPTIART